MKNKHLFYVIILLLIIGCNNNKKNKNQQVFPIINGSVVINQDLLKVCFEDNITTFNVYKNGTDPNMTTLIGGYNSSNIRIFSTDNNYNPNSEEKRSNFHSPKDGLLLFLDMIIPQNQIYSYNDIVDTIVKEGPCAYFIHDTITIISYNIDDKLQVVMLFQNYPSNYSIGDFMDNYYFHLP